MKWRWLIILLLIWGATGCGSTADEPEAMVGISEGYLAPDFELTTLTGGHESLRQHRGQPVLVNFFATWCKPCMREMPAIEAAYRRYQPQGLVVLAVDLNESADVIDQMRADKGLTFPLLLDPGSQIAHSYQTNSIPRTFYIDANGIIRKVIIGDQTESTITDAVTGLMQYGYQIPTVPATKPAGKPEKWDSGPGLTGCVNIKAALVRNGPGTNNRVMTQLSYQTCARFDARSADGTWLRLAHKDGSMRLWITADYIDLQGDFNTLPVAE